MDTYSNFVVNHTLSVLRNANLKGRKLSGEFNARQLYVPKKEILEASYHEIKVARAAWCDLAGVPSITMTSAQVEEGFQLANESLRVQHLLQTDINS